MATLKPLLLASVLLAAGMTLSACGTGGAVANARRSCHEVKIALATEKKSEVAGISTDKNMSDCRFNFSVSLTPRETFVQPLE